MSSLTCKILAIYVYIKCYSALIICVSRTKCVSLIKSIDLQFVREYLPHIELEKYCNIYLYAWFLQPLDRKSSLKLYSHDKC